MINNICSVRTINKIVDRPRVIVQFGLMIFFLLFIVHQVTFFNTDSILPFLPNLCLFKRITTWDCPGCGMGRAIFQLSQGNLKSAILLHPFSPIVIAWATEFAFAPSQISEKLKQNWLYSSFFPYMILILLITWWVVSKVAYNI